ncbi:MAG: DUF1289 domain-containing protein [Candidatus Accumulibacter sp.]|nr:DUF1289 domain-containing protein [Accumulibacter sp.]
MNENTVSYYCVGVCAPSETTGLCLGCGRPLQPPAPGCRPADGISVQIPSSDTESSEIRATAP